jgi:hypothetical protein
MSKITELKKVKAENGPMRSDIGFEGYFRFYKDDFGNTSVEELYFIAAYTKTFYYDDGWINDLIDEAKSQYLNDSLELIDLLLECDPEFKLDHFDDEDEFIISIVGFFIEEEGKDGDWETGYYSIPIFIPKIAGFDIVKKEDKAAIYNEGEDCYE